MARQLERLTVDKVVAYIARGEPGYYGDGGGLWLRIAPPTKLGTGAASWIFRYRGDQPRDHNGNKQRDFSIGPVHTVDIDLARKMAAECRLMRLHGLDPIEERRKQREAIKLQQAKQITFSKAAADYIATQTPGWKNKKHAGQWSATVETYANPIFGSKAVADVTADDVLACLRPIWVSKNETAARLRGRIESILDWATVKHLRTGDNPARWRGHLEHSLPTISRTARIKHHPALPYKRMAEFMLDLRQQQTTATACVELVILTACRSGEARGADWAEVDLDAGLWVIPAGRMKAGKDHRITLSADAVALLRKLHKPDASGLIFPGRKAGSMQSDMTLTKLLERMNKRRTDAKLDRWQDATGEDITVHGFRSAFRDWAAETTDYPGDLVELALAHAIGNKVEAAYRRGDQLAKRKQLMQDWADYCLADIKKAEAAKRSKATITRVDRF